MDEVIYKSPDGVLGAVPADMEGEAVKQKYIKATPEEAVEFRRKDALLKARKSSASPIPNAVEEAPDVVDFETQVAENIGKVVTPSPEERARIYDSIGPDPRFAAAGEFPQTVMTAVEQFVGGATAGIAPAFAGLINPAYTERKELREAANPRVAQIADIAGIVIPTAGTVAKAFGYAGKGAGALAKAAEMDVFNKLLETAPARKLYESYMRKLLGEEAFAEATEAAARKGAAAARLASDAAEKSPELWRVGLGKVLRTEADEVAAAAGEAAFSKAIMPFTLTELEQIYASKLAALGTEEGVIQSVIAANRRGDPLVKAAIEGGKISGKVVGSAALKAVPAIVSTGLYGGVSQGLEAASNAKASGEDVSTAFLTNFVGGAKTGAIVGGTIAVGVPSILHLGGEIVSGINEATQTFGQKVFPTLGTIFTKAEGKTTRKKDIATLLKSSAGDAETFDLAIETLAKDLTKEYGRARSYYRSLMDRLKETGLLTQEQVNAQLDLGAPALLDMEIDFMKANKAGKKEFDANKLSEWFRSEKGFDPQTKKVKLPPPLEALINRIIKNEEMFKQSTSGKGKLVPVSENYTPESYDDFVKMGAADKQFFESVKTSLQEEFPGTTGEFQRFRNEAKGLMLQDLIDAKMRTLEKAGFTNPFAKFGLPYVGAAGALAGDFSLEGVARAGAAFGLGQTGRVLADVFINPADTVKLMYEVNRLATRGAQASRAAATALLTPAGKKITRPLEFGLTEGITKPVILSDKDERELFFTERDKLNALSDPDVLVDTLQKTYGQLETVSPEMAKSAKETTAKSVQFLRNKLPPVREGIDPTKNEIKRFNKFYKYVKDPDGIMEEMARTKFVSDDGLEVLQTLYPSKLKQLRVAALEALSDSMETKQTIDSNTRYNIDKILGQKTTGFTNAQIKKIQDSMRPTGGNISGGSGKLPKLEGEGLPR